MVLKKYHRKILNIFGRKNILKISPKNIFGNFENHKVILYEKMFVDFFFHTKLLHDFQNFRKYFLEKFSKYLFDQKFSIFFDEFF